MKNVKWVTANLEDDLLGALDGYLTDGKDYKVVSASDYNEEILCPKSQFPVVDDRGNVNIFHSSWFDKPHTYNKKEVECYDEDFDDLVYRKPQKTGHGYYYIRLDTLSEEQKQHFKFKKYCDPFRTVFSSESQDILMTDRDTQGVWWTNNTDKMFVEGPLFLELSFNDIFKHRDEV